MSQNTVCSILFCSLLLSGWIGCARSGPSNLEKGAAPNPATAKGAKPSLQECKELCHRFDAAIKSVNIDGMSNQVDWQILLDTVCANIDADPGFKKSFTQSVHRARTMFVQIANELNNGGSFEFLRIHEVNGEMRALYRFVQSDASLNYHDLVLAKTGKGVKVVDFYVFSSGEKVSETMRRFYLIGAAGVKKGIFRKLSGIERDFVDNIKQVLSFTRAVKSANHREVMRIYKGLPKSLQQEKMFLLARIGSSSEVDDGEYKAAIEEFRRLYKDDESYDLISIDHYFLKKDYQGAVDCIDRLNKIVDDPYLLSFRAAMWVEANDYQKARIDAEKAVEKMPNFEEAYWTLVSVTLFQKDFKETARLLSLLQDKFGAEILDLSTVPEYAEFMKSPEYAKWKSNR